MNNPFEQKTPLDFQSIIFSLQTYWANQGALIWQPYYSQVGAGTMNPATFLRVLGPEPWKVAYVEPSVRPDDGRYGVNPNRLQQHYQFQVILKPDPGNPQQLYLDSLKALGIDPNQHDIRFVEDNWESPALSAWGLGWEVWLDGQEITQFTYFQQAGGLVLGVPAVEITYGLERIAMALQKVRDFKQIRWNSRRSYGDVNQVAEREHSTYYFEVANVDRLHQMFNVLVEEAVLALENGLVLPAYDNVIKCSHIFNVLDARGAVGFTERQALFGKMRDLSRRVAETYLAQRQEMEFPWLEANQPTLALEQLPLPVSKTETADFLLEIGTEELPTADLDSALVQLKEGVDLLLLNTRLGHGEVRVLGTPRRLVVYIENLQTKQTDRLSVVKGPPADRAFDAEGKPTKAAEGFARSRGLNTSQLTIRSMDGGDYVVAEVAEKGKAAIEVLSEMIPDLCNAIRFPKTMRWNETGASFSRPVRWLTALLGENVIPFSFAGLSAGRLTFGLRFSEKPFEELSDPQAYLMYIAEQEIVLDPAQRRLIIWDQAMNLAQRTGGTLGPDPDLLAEVANLVEKPTALLGSFEQRYLETLPPEVLIGVMKKHQRYFPVQDQNAKLTQHFIIIRNGGDQFAEMVVDGNLQVIHARFADADFFIREDREKPLESFVPKLAQLTFHKKLGSMLEKTERIQAITLEIAEQMDLPENLEKVLKRTALLCKADLATAMVVEMTELQGIIGKYYAELANEDADISQGIFEHYLPRNGEDSLPSGWPGLVIGIADRLDSIAGLFAVGLAPTGNKDPFALRRSALGLVQLLIGKNLDFDLVWGLERAGSYLPVPFSSEICRSALEFIGIRMRGLLLEEGFRYDVVDAVMHSQTRNPASAARSVRVLMDWVSREDWKTILPAYSRCVRITRELPTQFSVDPFLLTEMEEKRLFERLLQAEEKAAACAGDLNTILEQLAAMVDVINTFFDKILVMAEDEQLRQNRLGLLQRISNLILPLADFSALEGF